MSGPSDFWLAVAIGTGALLPVVRLILWRRSASDQAAPSWRLGLLIALNLVVAALLYLTLDPPDVGVASGRLVVLTAGAPAGVTAQPGDVLVALPEATDQTAVRAPDLATALRRHAEARTIHVVGAGLTARDREAVDRPVTSETRPIPEGILRLTLPDPVAAGAPFAVAGAVGGLPAGSVELVDPSGTVVDRTTVVAGDGFALTGAARASGLAVFDLRVKDAAGRTVERINVPVQAREPARPSVIVMAGAPGPEPRFLRRWAESVGIDLTVRLSLGAGVDLTARPAPLTAQTLAETDLLVIDERRWEMLGADERAAVRNATAGGMGLLLRPTGPLSETTRRDWAALGASLTGGETLQPLMFDDVAPSEDRDTRTEDNAAPAPELTRRDFAQGGDAAVLITGADGEPLATWGPFGSGRVGVWTVADSYALVLSGQSERYGALWSRMFSALARPEGAMSPRLEGVARAGERAGLCGIAAGDALTAPDGTRSRLIVDPRSGPSACAAIWPRASGWHAVVDTEGERGVIYVHPANATPSLVEAEMRQAMRDLQSGTIRATHAAATRRSGSPWPWFLALLAVSAGLWWLERRRPATSSTVAP